MRWFCIHHISDGVVRQFWFATVSCIRSGWALSVSGTRICPAHVTLRLGYFAFWIRHPLPISKSHCLDIVMLFNRQFGYRKSLFRKNIVYLLCWISQRGSTPSLLQLHGSVFRFAPHPAQIPLPVLVAEHFHWRGDDQIFNQPIGNG